MKNYLILLLVAIAMTMFSCGEEKNVNINDNDTNTDKCEKVGCSSHGVCKVVNNIATCNCDETYYADGLECKESTLSPDNIVGFWGGTNFYKYENEDTCKVPDEKVDQIRFLLKKKSNTIIKYYECNNGDRSDTCDDSVTGEGEVADNFEIKTEDVQQDTLMI